MTVNDTNECVMLDKLKYNRRHIFNKIIGVIIFEKLYSDSIESTHLKNNKETKNNFIYPFFKLYISKPIE